jgi:glycosyltransferase involved in cell wall biosynthesis
MTGPLRIAVDARPLAFPNSGIGRYTSSLLKEFAASNIEHPLFLYSDRPTQLPFELPSHWKLRTGKVNRRAMSTPFAQVAFPLWAIADRIDVFWSPRHHLPMLLPPSVRKVVTVHDMVWKRFPGTMTKGGHAIETLLMPASLRCADRIIAVSQFTRQEITGFYPGLAGKIDVIYEASTLSSSLCAHAPADHADSTYFLFVGSSEPRKNLARLLQAYLQYTKTGQHNSTTIAPLNLVIAGSYQWGEFDAQDFVARHQLTHRVRFVRDLDDAALAGLYAKARALVMPSLYEGFGLPLVEAMQWGLPIISSGSGSLSEVAGDAALTIDPQSAESICHALCELTTNTGLCMQLARNSKARGEQFQWQPAARQTLDVITRAARRPS